MLSVNAGCLIVLLKYTLAGWRMEDVVEEEEVVMAMPAPRTLSERNG
jgi:hypothetical protein